MYKMVKIKRKYKTETYCGKNKEIITLSILKMLKVLGWWQIEN